MDIVTSTLWLAIDTTIALTILALLAGFSPILYVTQAGIVSKATRRNRQTWAITTGVLVAIGLLLVLFQFFHLETLTHFVSSTVTAIAVNGGVHLVVGSACVYGGIRYTQHQASDVGPPETKRGPWALISFGFAKTLFSISGITATFLGGNLIATTSNLVIIRALLTVGFLLLVTLPFITITHLLARNPTKARKLLDSVAATMRKQSYRRAIGALIVIFGCIVISLPVVFSVIS